MSAQEHVVQVPRWPRIAAWVADDGSVRLDVGGVVDEHARAASLDEARQLVRELLRAEAVQLGRPARAWITDPQGSWPVIVDPSGAFEEDVDPGPRPASTVPAQTDAARDDEQPEVALFDEELLLEDLAEPFAEAAPRVDTPGAPVRLRARRPARRGAAVVVAGVVACSALVVATLAARTGPSAPESVMHPAVGALLQSRDLAVAGQRLRRRAVPPRRHDGAAAPAERRAPVMPTAVLPPAPAAVASPPTTAATSRAPARPAARASVACQEFGGC